MVTYQTIQSYSKELSKIKGSAALNSTPKVEAKNEIEEKHEEGSAALEITPNVSFMDIDVIAETLDFVDSLVYTARAAHNNVIY